MSLDPTFLNNFVLILTGFGGAFLAALWLSLVIWTYRDIKSRARDGLVYILATLVVAILSLPGYLIYLVLRPQFTLEEEYQKSLEEEVLLQGIEDQPVCPGCEHRISSDWQICPNCHTKIKKPCRQCGKLMELPWNICPICATPEYGLRSEDDYNVEDQDKDVNFSEGEPESDNLALSIPPLNEDLDDRNIPGEL